MLSFSDPSARIKPALAVAVGLLLGRELLRRARPADLSGRVVLIAGSSRGLGLALARELGGLGCRLALCARDMDELEPARQTIESLGAEVAVFACDVSDQQQVSRLIGEVTARFGQIDVLINNAGLINVGPLEHQTLEDFERAMAVMFWGAVYTTLATLPQMRTRRDGHIVTITSVGGKISVPHLLPYSAAKFAAVGFSEGLRAELARDGVRVLTVVPGLMRTGSHLNAEFKGRHRQEFGWFSLAATLPFTSISAEGAARQIVAAIKRDDAEVILSWQAALAARVHGLMPGVTVDLLGLVNRMLPRPGGIGDGRASGFDSRGAISESPLEAEGRRAARELNQF